MLGCVIHEAMGNTRVNGGGGGGGQCGGGGGGVGVCGGGSGGRKKLEHAM